MTVTVIVSVCPLVTADCKVFVALSAKPFSTVTLPESDTIA